MAPANRRQQRLPRGSLSAEMIVRASLRLLDEEGVNKFSMPRLGRELGADPTAVYRYFDSKDDLILAVADLLLEEIMAGFEPAECWLDTLADLSRRTWKVYTRHPAAGALSAYRTTRGPAEMRIIDVILAALQDAGFTGREAALLYRTCGDFALTWAGTEAGYLALDPEVRARDEAGWEHEYRAVDPVTYPHIWRVRNELPTLDSEEIFETALDLMLSSVAARAPRQCSCHPPHPLTSATSS